MHATTITNYRSERDPAVSYPDQSYSRDLLRVGDALLGLPGLTRSRNSSHTDLARLAMHAAAAAVAAAKP